MKKLVIFLSILSFLFGLSTQNIAIAMNEIASDKILKWEKMITPKGFIASTYIQDVKNCRKIWQRQMYLFKEKNPHVEDPDVIPEGTEILVQNCELNEELVVQEVIDKRSEKLVGQDVIYKQIDPIVTKVSEVNNYEYVVPFLHLYTGIINEKDSEDTDIAVGVGVTGDIFDNVGYELKMLGASSVIILNSEVKFKTKEAPYRYYFLLGLGNRVGLENKELNRLNKGADSFSYGGVGTEIYTARNIRYQLDVGANFAGTFAPNMSVSMQKLLKQYYWLGLYIDYRSTLNSQDSGDDRRYLSGGLKFSF